MSAITIGGDLIHYEKLGRGRPVILVHGWIGSWRYWIPLMQQLHLKYSVYTLDLIGFGDSAKNEANYSIGKQVEMMKQFMEQLGIPKAAFVGHGYGAMILTQFALKNPTKVARMLLSNAPLFDPGNLDERSPAGHSQLLTGGNTRYSLSPSPESLGYEDRTVPSSGTGDSTPNPDDRTLANQNNGAGALHQAETVARPTGIDRDALRKAEEERRRKKSNATNHLGTRFSSQTMIGLLEQCYKRSEPEFDKLKVDVERADNKVLMKSAEGFEAGEYLDDLRRVTSPTVIVHGESDPIIPAPVEDIWNYLTLGRDDVFVPIPLPGVRHFPMLEHSSFPTLANDFLSTADISKIEVRERWRRRSR